MNAAAKTEWEKNVFALRRQSLFFIGNANLQAESRARFALREKNGDEKKRKKIDFFSFSLFFFFESAAVRT